MKKIYFVLALLFATAILQADSISILWEGTWYDGEVLAVEGDMMMVSYDGWGSEWDEWVTWDRVVVNFEMGDAILIEWEGSWYPGVVYAQEGNEFYVSYDDYGDSWDEWATLDRITLP